MKSSKNKWHRDDVNKNFYADPVTFLTVSVYVFIFGLTKVVFYNILILCVSLLLQLLYVDWTKCDEVAVYRERPIFKNWKGFLIVRESKKAATGAFWYLELMPPYKEDEKEEGGEGFYNVDDKEEKVLETKEVIF